MTPCKQVLAGCVLLQKKRCDKCQETADDTPEIGFLPEQKVGHQHAQQHIQALPRRIQLHCRKPSGRRRFHSKIVAKEQGNGHHQHQEENSFDQLRRFLLFTAYRREQQEAKERRQSNHIADECKSSGIAGRINLKHFLCEGTQAVGKTADDQSDFCAKREFSLHTGVVGVHHKNCHEKHHHSAPIGSK